MKTRQFVLSVPSWVIPGTYAENLRFLESRREIKGVELLFFIYNDEVKTELRREWDEILSFRERFIYTAHLPEVLIPGHEELIALLAPHVRHFIIHPEIKNPAAQAKLLADWSLLYKKPFLAENTNPGHLETLLPYLPADWSLCMDTGHFLLSGQNPAAFFRANVERIGEIHLHGINPEQAALDNRLKDHRSLKKHEVWLAELLPLLENFNGVINLEMFSWEEIEPSIYSLSGN